MVVLTRATVFRVIYASNTIIGSPSTTLRLIKSPLHILVDQNIAVVTLVLWPLQSLLFASPEFKSNPLKWKYAAQWKHWHQHSRPANNRHHRALWGYWNFSRHFKHLQDSEWPLGHPMRHIIHNKSMSRRLFPRYLNSFFSTLSKFWQSIS